MTIFITMHLVIGLYMILSACLIPEIPYGILVANCVLGSIMLLTYLVLVFGYFSLKQNGEI